MDLLFIGLILSKLNMLNGWRLIVYIVWCILKGISLILEIITDSIFK